MSTHAEPDNAGDNDGRESAGDSDGWTDASSDFDGWSLASSKSSSDNSSDNSGDSTTNSHEQADGVAAAALRAQTARVVFEAQKHLLGIVAAAVVPGTNDGHMDGTITDCQFIALVVAAVGYMFSVTFF